MADGHATRKEVREIPSLNIDSATLQDQSSSQGSPDAAKSDELDKDDNSPLNAAEECIKSFLHQGVIDVLDTQESEQTSTSVDPDINTSQTTKNSEPQNNPTQIIQETVHPSRSSTPSDELHDKMSSAEKTINLLLEATNLAPEQMSDDRLSITADDDNGIQSDFKPSEAKNDSAATNLCSVSVDSFPATDVGSQDRAEINVPKERESTVDDMKVDKTEKLEDKKEQKGKHHKKHSKKKKKKHKKEKKKKKEKEKKEGKEDTANLPKAGYSSSNDSEDQLEYSTSTFLPSLVVLPSKNNNQELTSSSSSNATNAGLEGQQRETADVPDSTEINEGREMFEEKPPRKSRSDSQEGSEISKGQDESTYKAEQHEHSSRKSSASSIEKEFKEKTETWKSSSPEKQSSPRATITKEDNKEQRSKRSQSNEEKVKDDFMRNSKTDEHVSSPSLHRNKDRTDKRDKENRSKSTTLCQDTSRSASKEPLSRQSSYSKDGKSSFREHAEKSYHDSSSKTRQKSRSRSPKKSGHKKHKRHRSRSKSPKKDMHDSRFRSPTSEQRRHHRSRSPQKDKARSKSQSPHHRRKKRKSPQIEHKRSKSPRSHQKYSTSKSFSEERKWRSRSSSRQKDEEHNSGRHRSRSKSPKKKTSDGKTIPKSFSRYASFSPKHSTSRSPSKERDRKSGSSRKFSRNLSEPSRSRSRTPSQESGKRRHSHGDRSPAKRSWKLSVESDDKLGTLEENETSLVTSHVQHVDSITTQPKSTTGIPRISEANSESDSNLSLLKMSTETPTISPQTPLEVTSHFQPQYSTETPTEDKTLTSPKRKRSSSSETASLSKKTKTISNKYDERKAETLVERTVTSENTSLEQSETESLQRQSSSDNDEKMDSENKSETTAGIIESNVALPIESHESSEPNTKHVILDVKTATVFDSSSTQAESIKEETGTSNDVITRGESSLPTMHCDAIESDEFKGTVDKDFKNDKNTEHIVQPTMGNADGPNITHLPPPPAPPAPIPYPNTFNTLGQFNPHGGIPGVGFAPHMQGTHPPMGNVPQFPMRGGVSCMDHPAFQPNMNQLPPHQSEANFMGHFSTMQGGPPGFVPAVQDCSNQNLLDNTLYQENQINQTSLGLPSSASLIPFLGETELPKTTNGGKDEPAGNDINEPAATTTPMDMEMSSPEVDIIEKMNEEFWENEQKAQDEAYEPELLPDEPVFPVSPVMSSAHDSKSTVKKSKGDKKKSSKKHKEEPKDDQPKTKVQVLLDRLHRQARVEEEVKLVLKEYYKHRDITKEEYKDILRKAVPQVANSNHSIDPERIRSLVKKYVAKTKGARLHKK